MDLVPDLGLSISDPDSQESQPTFIYCSVHYGKASKHDGGKMAATGRLLQLFHYFNKLLFVSFDIFSLPSPPFLPSPQVRLRSPLMMSVCNENTKWKNKSGWKPPSQILSQLPGGHTVRIMCEIHRSLRNRSQQESTVGGWKDLERKRSVTKNIYIQHSTELVNEPVCAQEHYVSADF